MRATADEPDKRPPISVKFEIPYFTTSGINIKYLKVSEKSGYPALPWVRYITQNGGTCAWGSALGARVAAKAGAQAVGSQVAAKAGAQAVRGEGGGTRRLRRGWG